MSFKRRFPNSSSKYTRKHEVKSEKVKTSVNILFCFHRKMHKLTLPENWCEVITMYPELFSSDDGIGDKIIYKTMNSEPESAAAGDILNMTSSVIQRTINQPDELILPWHEKHWNVFITNPVSTVEVWARIIGPEYSVSWLMHKTNETIWNAFFFFQTG